MADSVFILKCVQLISFCLSNNLLLCFHSDAYPLFTFSLDILLCTDFAQGHLPVCIDVIIQTVAFWEPLMNKDLDPFQIINSVGEIRSYLIIFYVSLSTVSCSFLQISSVQCSAQSCQALCNLMDSNTLRLPCPTLRSFHSLSLLSPSRLQRLLQHPAACRTTFMRFNYCHLIICFNI